MTAQTRHPGRQRGRRRTWPTSSARSIAIYPITPSSPMGEWADQWAAEGKPNLWGTVPQVVEMQSEGGAAGAVHGALQAGALATTFTASQGLLLMIPNMYKIAGELTPAVIHVAARSLAAQGLSIFGDHSDVMAARATGFAMLASNSVQEALDLALIAHAATLESRIPFLHFFDGFRTSHEVMQDRAARRRTDLRAMIDDDLVRAHRARGAVARPPGPPRHRPEPRRLFPGREAVNPYYLACPTIVQNAMDRFAGADRPAVSPVRLRRRARRRARDRDDGLRRRGRRGDRRGPDRAAARRSACSRSACTGRSRSSTSWPRCRRRVKTLAVLDRTKEPGSIGEPLYLDVVAALHESADGPRPRVDRRALRAVVEGVHAGDGQGASSTSCSSDRPRNHFTIGIRDDVTHTSLDLRSRLLDRGPATRCGPCSTAWAPTARSAPTRTRSRSSARRPTNYAQGYFVYDSKKSGSVTVSHLRFGPRPIRSTYLISRASFVACHQFALPGAHRRADGGRAGRDVPAEQPATGPTRSGTTCRARCRSRSSTRSCAST